MKYILFSLFISSGFYSICQSHGFFGKKNILTFSGSGAIPIINMIGSNIGDPESKTHYKKSGNSLVEGRNIFDGGFNASFVHAFSNNFGFGFDYGMYFSNCYGPSRAEVTGTSGWTTNVEINHETLDLTTMTFMPKIEFSSNYSLLSLGLHSEFGLGYSMTKVKEKDYLSVLEPFYTEEFFDSYDQRKVFNQKNKYHSFAIMYGLKTRMPITKSLFFQVGVRYTLNLNTNLMPGDSFFSNSSQSGFYNSKSSIAARIASYRALSLVTGNIGIALMF